MDYYKVADDILTEANCNTNVETFTVQSDMSDKVIVDKIEYEKKVNTIQSLVEDLRKLGGIWVLEWFDFTR